MIFNLQLAIYHRKLPFRFSPSPQYRKRRNAGKDNRIKRLVEMFEKEKN